MFSPYLSLSVFVSPVWQFYLAVLSVVYPSRKHFGSCAVGVNFSLTRIGSTL